MVRAILLVALLAFMAAPAQAAGQVEDISGPVITNSLPGVADTGKTYSLPTISKRQLLKKVRERLHDETVSMFPEYGEHIFRGAEVAGGVAVTAYKFIQEGDDLSFSLGVTDNSRLRFSGDRYGEAGMTYEWSPLPERDGHFKFEAQRGRNNDYSFSLRFRMNLN
jgi:hypothetical protein